VNPTYWLLIVLAAMAFVIFFTGLAAYQLGYDQGHLDAEPDRHTHRKGDPLPPLPRPGRLPLDVPPGPTLDPFSPAAFMFSGAAEEWRPLGRAEYDLITTELPAADDFPCCSSLDAETDSGFTRRMAREVEAMIAAWEGDTNYWLHTHRADT
jgi:hypothetical protein